MKLKEIVQAYKLLGKAKAGTIEDGEVLKILKARATLKPYADAYEAYLKDCQEKFKPDNWEDVEAKMVQWQQGGSRAKLSDEEKVEIMEIATNYQKKMDEAMKPEEDKEIQVSLERLNQGSEIKIMRENGWTVEDLEVLKELRPKI